MRPPCGLHAATTRQSPDTHRINTGQPRGKHRANTGSYGLPPGCQPQAPCGLHCSSTAQLAKHAKRAKAVTNKPTGRYAKATPNDPLESCSRRRQSAHYFGGGESADRRQRRAAFSSFSVFRGPFADALVHDRHHRWTQLHTDSAAQTPIQAAATPGHRPFPSVSGTNRCACQYAQNRRECLARSAYI
jgi:hypothetical protein